MLITSVLDRMTLTLQHVVLIQTMFYLFTASQESTGNDTTPPTLHRSQRSCHPPNRF